MVLLIALIIIQFSRPKKNICDGIAVNDISSKYTIPTDISDILKVSCYDCHSNNTVYPWYNNIQPVAWWLQYHVNHGKHGLNFSEFFSYTPMQQVKKLKNISREIKEDGMPLDSYLWIHKYAALSPEEKDLVIAWADSVQEQIAGKNHLPAK